MSEANDGVVIQILLQEYPVPASQVRLAEEIVAEYAPEDRVLVRERCSRKLRSLERRQLNSGKSANWCRSARA
jgi:hypothetical protein